MPSPRVIAKQKNAPSGFEETSESVAAAQELKAGPTYDISITNPAAPSAPAANLKR